MEEQTPKHMPAPGLPEALHPEIGNGAAWEDNRHAFLLRSPDPTRHLDDLIGFEGRHISAPLTPNEMESDQLIQKDTFQDESISSPEMTTHEGPAENEKERIVADVTSEADATSPSEARKEKNGSKGKKKSKSGKNEHLPETDTTQDQNQLPAEEKKPKTGKLLRKAAKSVKKQEDAKKMETTEELGYPESSLSPYTKWLKSLTGSEYVHPYEDDFAFEQGNNSTKQGISETFADLLAAQGYKEQALEMYVKLMEKYPEKSAFFAAKIEALQH